MIALGDGIAEVFNNISLYGSERGSRGRAAKREARLWNYEMETLRRNIER